MKKLLGFALLGTLLLLSTPAAAYDWTIETTLVVVEPTYVPEAVQFQIPVAAGSCAAGTWLKWNARGSDSASKIANAQAILSIMVAAEMSGKRIRIMGNNAGCTIDYIHLLPS